MIRWEHLDTARAPDGEELRLMRRGAEYSIMVGANELMNSRLSHSEEALATLAIERLRAPAPRVLIGGFGMGFTLRAALGRLGPSAHATVAELVPAVIAWARGPMAELSAACLADPRTAVFEGDVGEAIRAGDWDAILLDVDNGPEGLSRPANDGLYSLDGLAAAKAALNPGGVLAVWSSAPSIAFSKRLRQAGFTAEEHQVRARKGKGARHIIWLATR
jgi:spermidine synthase